MGIEIGVAGIIGAIVIALGFFVWMTSSFYKHCPPNQAMIISGVLSNVGTQVSPNGYSGPACTAVSTAGGGHKVVIGGGTVVFPVIQQASYLSLECMSIALEPSTPYVTKDGTQIKFRAVAQVKVKADPVSVLIAAEAFLNQTSEQITALIREVMLAHTRSLAGTLSYTEILHDLNGFSMRVQEESISSLMKFGMTVITYSIDEMENSPAQIQSLVFDAAMKS